MPDGSKVTVRGAARLAATLAKAGRDLGKMDTANRSVAMAIAQRSRAVAPKKSGRMARSTTGADLPPNGARVIATAKYAGPVHFGVPRHNISARPYVSDTVHALQSTWVDTYGTEAQNILNNVTGA